MAAQQEPPWGLAESGSLGFIAVPRAIFSQAKLLECSLPASKLFVRSRACVAMRELGLERNSSNDNALYVTLSSLRLRARASPFIYLTQSAVFQTR